VLRGAARRLAWRYLEPGKPVQNAFVASFNSKLRDERRTERVFLSLAGARETSEAWRRDYNYLRPQWQSQSLNPKRVRSA